MSPKGGIKPHDTFAIKSSRSEVLFVDYIAEHLSDHGRAGIIVPDGIVFQNLNPHKQLRKMLVEDYLVAVISLPAGPFQPYSGVKTSVLILDRTLAKQTDRIAFFKVENDGYELGAQRRPISKNDLPQVQDELTEYLNKQRAGHFVNDLHLTLSLAVKKEKIAADGNYILSGEWYQEGGSNVTQWPMVPLSEIVDIESGSRQKGGAVNSGIPSIGGEHIDDNGDIRFDKMKYVSEEHFQKMKKGILKNGDVLVVKDGATTGKTGFFPYTLSASVNEHVFILRARESVHPYYLYWIVRSDAFQEGLKPYIKGIIGGINLEIKEIQIPLPPMNIQE